MKTLVIDPTQVTHDQAVQMIMSGGTICVEDFCGTDDMNNPVQYWADWRPATGMVTFGGLWGSVEPVYFPTQPTAEQVHEYVDSVLDHKEE